MKKISHTSIQKFFLYLLMPAVLLILTVNGVNANYFHSKKPDEPLIIGRWDITMNVEGKIFPSWLEVHHSGYHTLVGEFVGIVGSARPVSLINFADGKVSFSLPPQWEQGSNNLSFEGILQGDSLTGTMTSADGKKYSWTAVRAPSLHKQMEIIWGNPMHLFTGTNLKGWHALGENQWQVQNGILRSPQSGSNLITDETFRDFKLHIEFRYPKGSNSGVYLRGRYEVQIEDDEEGQPLKDQLGAVYGFIAPSESAGNGAGEWQTYDITLIGRMVTVVLNGKTVICNREIPGITGGAINSKEEEPGPLLIQGDHGPIDYRNIIITQAK